MTLIADVPITDVLIINVPITDVHVEILPAYETLPKTLEIIVTWEDIQKGVEGSFTHCAIARAVKRTTGRECYFSRSLTIYQPHQCGDYQIVQRTYHNEYARLWAKDFDRDRTRVTPERFVFRSYT